jgi:hypothetical protein
MLKFKLFRSLLIVAALVSSIGCFGTRNRCCSSKPTISSAAPCCPNDAAPIPPPGLNQ